MKKTVFIAAILLLAACGNSGIELNNATGMDLDRVTLTIGDNTQTWDNVEADQTIRSSLKITDSALPVRVDWEASSETGYMEYFLIDRAAEAKRVSILFAPEEVSINYSF